MNMKILIYAVFLILLVNNAMAIGLAINPVNINMTDLLRNGYAERDFRVSTSTDEQLTIRRSLKHNATANDWISFEPNVTSFNISEGNPQRMTVIVEPPADVPNGVYKTLMRFRIDMDRDFEGQTSAIIETAVASRLSIEISDDEIVDCQVLSSNVENAEMGNEIDFDFRTINYGNVWLNPEVEIDVWNKDQSEIVKTVRKNKTEIGPTLRKEFTTSLSTDDLDIGQYFADVSVEPCGFEDTMTFDVLEPGAMSVSGKLVQIKNKVWNNVGDDIEVKPIFKNTGEKDVSAVFKGDIMLDNKVVKNLESGNMEIESSETGEIPMTFSPEKPGRYKVKGRIYYEDKQSFEKSNVINVNPSDVEYNGTNKEASRKESSEQSSSALIYIAIIVVILLLLIMIKKKKKKRY
ncbi:MAG: hypothetical protein ACQEP1_01240 [Nanobdellota archaeon]